MYNQAYQKEHNCSNKKGHSFNLELDQEKAKKIKDQTGLSVPVWICKYCDKFTQSV